MTELAERYVEAWNSRDPLLVAGLFADDGTYEDPTTDGPVTGPGIGEAAGRLFGAFPDVSFEPDEILQGESTAALQWTMRGTNTGSFAGAPPTDRVIEVRGAQFLRAAGDLVASAVGHLDQRTVALQLGLQAPILPFKAGPFRLGASVHLETGSRARPGAISFTRIDMGSRAGLLRLRDYSRPVLGAMAGMESVIASALMNDGERVGYTVTAWSSPEAATEILGQDEHRKAMRAFFSDGLGVAAWTSVWVPARFNTLWVRCGECGSMQDVEAAERCSCGSQLPEAPPYF